MMNKEIIKELLIISIVIAIAVMPTAVNADGCVIPVAEISPELEKHIGLPSQKAAISWDGENETLIISTKIKGENLTNLAWITPILSETKPEVEKGDVEIFRDIGYLFSEIEVRYIHRGGYYVDPLPIIFLFTISLIFLVVGLVKRKNKKIAIPSFIFAIIFFVFGFLFLFSVPIGGPGVGSETEINPLKLIEAKKVGIYDVLILKATNSSYMIDWLDKHNYKISNKSIPILQDYCDQENFYFVVNKINTENLSEEKRTKIKEDLSKGAVTPLMIKFRPKGPFYPLEMSSMNKGNTTINVYFFSDEPVRDRSGILKIKDVRDIEKVEYWFKRSQYSMSDENFTIDLPIPYEKRLVTWLQYRGNLNNLEKDSYFVFDALTCKELPPVLGYDRYALVKEGIILDKDDCCYRVAMETKNSSLCEMIQDIRIRNKCYVKFALETQNVSLCEKVFNGSYWYEGDRAHCYYDVAIKLNDSSICENISDEYWKDRCQIVFEVKR